MKSLIKYLIVLYSISSVLALQAQSEDEVSYSRFSAKAAIGNHAVGFPFQNSFSAINPHFSLGAEYGINKNPKNRFFAATNLGFIGNDVIGNTITLDLDLGYRFTHKSGLLFETDLGLGILNQYHPGDIYELDTSDGTYDKIKDKGTSASLVGFRMGLGYDLSRKSDFPFRLSLNHHFFIQSPYFDVKNFPIMPQSTTNITVTYKFKKL